MQDVKRSNEVKQEEIQKLAEMYRKMTPANRFFMVSASGLLLASQSGEGAMREKQEVKAG